MIKIYDEVWPSQEQYRSAALSMRHAMNSEIYSDTPGVEVPQRQFGNADYILAKKLVKSGEYNRSHCKFLRQLPVSFTITAPMYFWKEADTYKVGTVRNSSSTMHKIAAKEFTIDDFSHDHLLGTTDSSEPMYDENHNRVDGVGHLCLTINLLNYYRDKYNNEQNANTKKTWWWQMIQLLPSSYNQTSTISLNYEVLHKIYIDRNAHKLDEWREFCHWIKERVPMSDLIVPEYEVE